MVIQDEQEHNKPADESRATTNADNAREETSGSSEVITANPVQTSARREVQPQEQQAALLRRYLENGATVTREGETVVIINPPAPPRWRRTKRAFKAVLLLFLMIVSNIILMTFGGEGLISGNQWIDRIWWPATLIRFMVYPGISWLLLPALNRHIRSQAKLRIDEHRQASLADGVLDHERLKQLQDAEARIANAGFSPGQMCALLIGFELFALQLPYLLH